VAGEQPRRVLRRSTEALRRAGTFASAGL